MKDLTDLEICRKIANIEDVVYMETKYKGNANFIALVSENDFTGTPPEMIGKYDPLNDGYLCWKLMIEHEMTVGFTECPAGTGRAYFATGNHKVTRNNVCSEYCSTPNKALLLAIIEANKENNHDK